MPSLLIPTCGTISMRAATQLFSTLCDVLDSAILAATDDLEIPSFSTASRQRLLPRFYELRHQQHLSGVGGDMATFSRMMGETDSTGRGGSCSTKDSLELDACRQRLEQAAKRIESFVSEAAGGEASEADGDVSEAGIDLLKCFGEVETGATIVAGLRMLAGTINATLNPDGKTPELPFSLQETADIVNSMDALDFVTESFRSGKAGVKAPSALLTPDILSYVTETLHEKVMEKAGKTQTDSDDVDQDQEKAEAWEEFEKQGYSDSYDGIGDCLLAVVKGKLLLDPNDCVPELALHLNRLEELEQLKDFEVFEDFDELEESKADREESKAMTFGGGRAGPAKD